MEHLGGSNMPKVISPRAYVYKKSRYISDKTSCALIIIRAIIIRLMVPFILVPELILCPCMLQGILQDQRSIEELRFKILMSLGDGITFSPH